MSLCSVLVGLWTDPSWTQTGCLTVSWLSWRTSALMIPSSWRPPPRPSPTPASPATTTSSVWLETESASRYPSVTQGRGPRGTTSSPTTTHTSPGVTCVENSSGGFSSRVCAVPVSTPWPRSVYTLQVKGLIKEWSNLRILKSTWWTVTMHWVCFIILNSRTVMNF